MNGRLYLAYRTTGTGCGPETLMLKISTTQRLQWSALAGRCLDRCKIALLPTRISDYSRTFQILLTRRHTVTVTVHSKWLLVTTRRYACAMWYKIDILYNYSSYQPNSNCFFYTTVFLCSFYTMIFISEVRHTRISNGVCYVSSFDT